MNKAVLILLSFSLILGCSQVTVLRTQRPTAGDAPPHIDQVVDLGALPLPQGGELSRSQSDGVFTPGEWTALLGDGLARGDARVDIGGLQIPIASYLQHGLLVRIPRGLSPRARHSLRVQTALGQSEQEILFHSHVVVSDVSGNRLRFLPMGADAEKLFLKPHDVPLTRVRKHVFSPDGGLVYAVQAHSEQDDGQYTLAMVHAAAPEQPALVSTMPVQLSAVPQDLVMVAERAQLWMMSRRELVVFDLHMPSVPRELARIQFAEGTAWSLASLAGGTRAAVLERDHNQLWLLDMTGTQPELIQTLPLEPEGMARASIAVLADPRNSARLWVLQGRSLGRFAKRVNDTVAPVRSTLTRAQNALGLSSSARAAEAQPEPPVEGPAPPARVLTLVLSPMLIQKGELPLPGGSVPLFMSPGSDGRLLVSALESDAARVEGFRDNPTDLATLTHWLGGTLQFGRVLAVDPEGARPPESLAQGMALFFDMTQLPDGQLVCSTMRIGVHGFLPGLGVDWNIEAPHVAALRMRTLKWTFVLPPYVSPPVSVQ